MCQVTRSAAAGLFILGKPERLLRSLKASEDGGLAAQIVNLLIRSKVSVDSLCKLIDMQVDDASSRLIADDRRNVRCAPSNNPAISARLLSDFLVRRDAGAAAAAQWVARRMEFDSGKTGSCRSAGTLPRGLNRGGSRFQAIGCNFWHCMAVCDAVTACNGGL